jgi:ABC-2 type transport system permease protein
VRARSFVGLVARRSLLIGALGARRAGSDRRLLLVSLALPVLVILVVGSLFGSGTTRAPVEVVTGRSAGPLGEDLVRSLKASSALVVHRQASEKAALADLRRGLALAVVVVPDGYSRLVERGRRATVRLVETPGQAASAAAALAVSQVVDRQAAAIAAADAAASLHVPFGVALSRAQRAAGSLLEPGVSGTGSSLPTDPFSYTAPANLVLFVTITSLISAVGPVEDRRSGLLKRVLATPTPASAVVAGQLLGAFAVALGQATVLLAVGSVLFGVGFGDPFAVVLLLVGVALVSAASGSLLATVASTPEQVVAVAVPAGIVEGMLGGCLWPLSIVGSALRDAGHVVPTAWAMDGFVQLIYGHGGLAQVAWDLVALFGFGAVLVLVAVVRLRRLATR